MMDETQDIPGSSAETEARASGLPRAVARIVLLMVACAFTAGALEPDRGVQPAEATPPTDRDLAGQLDDLDRRAAEITSLRADFVQRKHTAMLKKPIVSAGRLVVRGAAARWDTLTPRASVMAVDAESVRIYYPDQKTVEVYELGDALGDMTATPLPRLAKLRESFDIRRITPAEAGEPPADKPADTAPDKSLALELTPRGEPLRSRVARVRVVIDTGPPCAKRMLIDDADGDRTEIEFFNVRTNVKVEEGEVALRPPRGTREVRPLGPAPPPEPPR